MKTYRSGKINQLVNRHIVILLSTVWGVFLMFTLHFFETIQSLVLGFLSSNNNLILEQT